MVRTSTAPLRAPDNTARAPKLSVLVPAYEYPSGVRRILDAIADSAGPAVECVISDDSRSDEVEQAVLQHPLADRVIYLRNRPPLGAIPNWNRLLQSAYGQFVMVLHHDECPIQPRFFALLCDALTDSTDALVLDCFIGTPRNGRMRRHFPLMLKDAVLRHWPSYLLRRNLMGAPSVLVLRKDRILPFDARVPWMVDVEWYGRVMRQPGLRLKVSRDLALISVHHEGSITASFGNALSDMARRESALLRAENPTLSILSLSAPRTFGERLSSKAETLAWWTVRSVTRLVATLLAKPIPARLLRTWD